MRVTPHAWLWADSRGLPVAPFLPCPLMLQIWAVRYFWPTANGKAVSKLTDPAHGERLPVHSFHTLPADLATLTRNVVRLADGRDHVLFAAPTKGQRWAFDLLGVSRAA